METTYLLFIWYWDYHQLENNSYYPKTTQKYFLLPQNIPKILPITPKQPKNISYYPKKDEK